MTEPANTVYDPNAPGAQQWSRPWQSNEERLTAQALMAASAPSELIRSMEPWNRVDPFPDRFLPHPRPLTPASLFAAFRDPYERLDFSGQQGGYAGGTSTPATSWW